MNSICEARQGRQPDRPRPLRRGGTADPQLFIPGSSQLVRESVNGYKLGPASPALNAGLLISDNGGRDYWGNPVSDSAAPHLGAYNGSPIQSAEKQ